MILLRYTSPLIERVQAQSLGSVSKKEWQVTQLAGVTHRKDVAWFKKLGTKSSIE